MWKGWDSNHGRIIPEAMLIVPKQWIRHNCAHRELSLEDNNCSVLQLPGQELFAIFYITKLATLNGLFIWFPHTVHYFCISFSDPYPLPFSAKKVSHHVPFHVHTWIPSEEQILFRIFTFLFHMITLLIILGGYGLACWLKSKTDFTLQTKGFVWI